MKITLNEGATSGEGGNVGGNFCSFIFTEAGRRVLEQDDMSLTKVGWQIAIAHRDRADVAARFREQEGRDRLVLHSSYEERLERARRENDELLARLSGAEGRAAWIRERRADMTAGEAKFARIADDQVRRMQILVDELEAWKTPEVLAGLRTDLISDARNWRPPYGPPVPDWAKADDSLVAHDVKRHAMAVVMCSNELSEEKAKIERLNEWLAAMRAAFGSEPEGYWSD